MSNGLNTDQEVSDRASNLDGGWRPIETAPKDGSLILCGYADAHGMKRYSLRYWSVGSWGSASEGWSDQWRQLRKEQPTHWMPLPPAP